MSDGIFTPPGPDGILGRGGPPGDMSAPTIDGDGTMLRETLVAVYPSPGHLRVARAIRHPQSGKVEWQEEYRMPTPEEVDYLAKRGLVVGQGSMVQQQNTPIGGLGADVAPTPTQGQPTTQSDNKFPWVKLGVAVVAGAAGFWAVKKYVVPRVLGDKNEEVDDDDGDVEDDGDE